VQIWKNVSPHPSLDAQTLHLSFYKNIAIGRLTLDQHAFFSWKEEVLTKSSSTIWRPFLASSCHNVVHAHVSLIHVFCAKLISLCLVVFEQGTNTPATLD
jgi:hypothetical protein